MEFGFNYSARFTSRYARIRRGDSVRTVLVNDSDERFSNKVYSVMIGGAIVQRVERWTCDQYRSRVQILLEATLRNNVRQVVHTYMCLCHQAV